MAIAGPTYVGPPESPCTAQLGLSNAFGWRGSKPRTRGFDSSRIRRDSWVAPSPSYELFGCRNSGKRKRKLSSRTQGCWLARSACSEGAVIADESLSSQIADVFSLLGVLLVFVIAFYSYLLTRVQGLIARPRPVVEDERLKLLADVGASIKLLIGLLAGSLAILLLLLPLSVEVVADLIAGQRRSPTSEGGLLFVDGFLGVILLAISGLWKQARRRVRDLS